MYPAYRLGWWLSDRLSHTQAYRLAEWGADVQWRRAAERRRHVQANLALALGRPVDERDPLVHEVFRHFGRYLAEFFTAHRGPTPGLEVEGWPHLLRAREAGRGVLIVTGHLGNWELGAVLLRRRGLPLTAVALPHADGRIDRLFTAQRARLDVPSIPLGPGASARVLALLRRGEVVAIVGDQEFGGHGAAVELFGRPAVVAGGPPTLSVRAGAPIVPSALLRTGPWHFRLVLEPPLWPAAGGPLQERVQALARAYAACLERHVRRQPTQWMQLGPAIGTPRTFPGARPAAGIPSPAPGGEREELYG